MDYEKQFHNLVLGGKGVFVFLLLILSFINGHKDFVEKNPRGSDGTDHHGCHCWRRSCMEQRGRCCKHHVHHNPLLLLLCGVS